MAGSTDRTDLNTKDALRLNLGWARALNGMIFSKHGKSCEVNYVPCDNPTLIEGLILHCQIQSRKYIEPFHASHVINKIFSRSHNNLCDYFYVNLCISGIHVRILNELVQLLEMTCLNKVLYCNKEKTNPWFNTVNFFSAASLDCYGKQMLSAEAASGGI